ncbi:MAG TPA: hypothetical protein VF895_02010 [Gaiellaceae bacterium]
MERSSERTAVLVLALISTVLVVVGCVSTWAKQGGNSYNGTDANAGKTTLIAAVIALAFLALATWKSWRWAAIVAAIPAAIASAIASYRWADVANFVADNHDATAGWGIVVATIAAIALFVLCFVHAFLPTGAAAPAAPPSPPPAQLPPEQPPAP